VTSVLSTEYMEGLTASEVIQAFGLQLVRAPYTKEGRPGLGRGTHLTVYRAQSIKADHVNDYSYKRGQARQ
jgi:hypothetical protein